MSIEDSDSDGPWSAGMLSSYTLGSHNLNQENIKNKNLHKLISLYVLYAGRVEILKYVMLFLFCFT